MGCQEGEPKERLFCMCPWCRFFLLHWCLGTVRIKSLGQVGC